MLPQIQIYQRNATYDSIEGQDSLAGKVLENVLIPEFLFKHQN